MDPSSPASSHNSDPHYWSDDGIEDSASKSTKTPTTPRSTKKSKGLSKKSQLTPRVALYIPPHLQRYQKDAALSAAVKPNNEISISQKDSKQAKQLKLDNALYSKAKEKIKSYQQKQNIAISNSSNSKNNTLSNETNKKIKTKRKKDKLPENLFSCEIKELIKLKNTSYKSFLKNGSEVDLKKSKQAKSKLRYLIRKSRSNLKPAEANPYKELADIHTKHYGDDSPDLNISTETNTMEVEEKTSDISSNEDEEAPDSSFYFSMKRRMSSRLEWSEAILKYNRDPSYLLSRSGLVKEEVVVSDEDDNHDMNVEEEEESDDDCREKRSRRRDYNKTPAVAGSESETSSRRSVQEVAINSSDNEYLNQQFLRQQHDFERQQKFNQLASVNGGRDHSIFSSPDESHTHFLSDKTRDTSNEKSFDQTLKDYRLHDLNRYKNNSAHEDFDTLLSELRPINVKKSAAPSPMPCPPEPFRDCVRYKKSKQYSAKTERMEFVKGPQRPEYPERHSQYPGGYKTVRYGSPEERSYPLVTHPPSGRLSPYSERLAQKETSREVQRYSTMRQPERRYLPLFFLFFYSF